MNLQINSLFNKMNYNIFLLGDRGTGKSSFLKRFEDCINKNISENISDVTPTKGVNAKKVQITPRLTYTFYDFDGNGLFKDIYGDYYNMDRPHLVIFFFDGTSLLSLYSLSKFLCEFPDEKNIPYLILGTKYDIEGNFYIYNFDITEVLEEHLADRKIRNILGNNSMYACISSRTGHNFINVINAIGKILT